MAKGWFDQSAATFYPADRVSYLNNTVKSNTNVSPGYSPRQEGYLTILGKTLQGIAAPFAGDYQWNQRQAKIDLEQQQADMEFAALLEKNRMVNQENKNQEALRNAQIRIYNAQAGLMEDPSKMAQYSGFMNQNDMSTPLASDYQPTLTDAIPIRTEKFINKKGITSSGKPTVTQIVNPEFEKALQLRNSSVKELEDTSTTLERIASNIDNLKSAVDATPEFKEGAFSKQKAQVSNLWADWSNEPWYKDYELSYNQGFLPLAQALNASKVLSDADLKNIQKSLGDPTTPKRVKKNAINQIEKAIQSGATSKLKAFGVNFDTYSKIYPNTYSKFISNNKNELKKDTLNKENLFDGI